MIVYDCWVNPVIKLMFKALSFSDIIKNTKCYQFYPQLNFLPGQIYLSEWSGFSGVALMKLFHSSWSLLQN